MLTLTPKWQTHLLTSKRNESISFFLFQLKFCIFLAYNEILLCHKHLDQIIYLYFSVKNTGYMHLLLLISKLQTYTAFSLCNKCFPGWKSGKKDGQNYISRFVKWDVEQNDSNAKICGENNHKKTQKIIKTEVKGHWLSWFQNQNLLSQFGVKAEVSKSSWRFFDFFLVFERKTKIGGLKSQTESTLYSAVSEILYIAGLTSAVSDMPIALFLEQPC